MIQPLETTAVEWFRLYDKIIDDPKVLVLKAQLWRHYIELMCVASRQPSRGSLPSMNVIAAHLRISAAKARRAVAELIEHGLIDESPDDGTLSIHGWDRRQRKSDDVAARVAKHRVTNTERESQRRCNVTEPLPHACVTETDTETENTPPPPPRGVRERVEAPPIRRPAPPNSPDYRAVLTMVPDRWGPQAIDLASRLLAENSPEAVRYGLEDVQERFGGKYDHAVGNYWRNVTLRNPDGRPLPELNGRRREQPAPPPPKFHRAAEDEVLSLPSEAERRRERLSLPRGAASGA